MTWDNVTGLTCLWGYGMVRWPDTLTKEFHMDDLKAVAAALRDLDHVRHEQVDHRDTLVVDAYRAGTPIAHIAKAAGLTRARVYAIIDRTTKEARN